MFKVFSDDIKAITIFVSRCFFFFLHRAIADFAAIDISAVSCFRLAYFLLIKEVLEHGYQYSTFIKTQLLDPLLLYMCKFLYLAFIDQIFSLMKMTKPDREDPDPLYFVYSLYCLTRNPILGPFNHRGAPINA